LILLLLAASTAIEAQETSQYDKGTPPQQAAGVSSLGSYMSTDLGTVNLSNGSLNFRIPLGTVGGRGFSIPLTLNYSSKVWSATKGQDYNSAFNAWYPAAYAVYGDPKSGGGWQMGAAPTIAAQGVGITAQACPGSNCGGYSKGLTKLTVKLPDKGEVELRDDLYDGSPLSAQPDSLNISRLDDNRGQRWHATDGSGTIFISDNANGVVKGDLNGVLITGDGTRYRFNMTYSGTPMTLNMSVGAYCDSITDRNGNQITISYPSSTETRFTDQLGRITKIQANAPDPANPSVMVPVLVTFPGYSGTTQGQARYFKLKSGVMNQNYRSGINPVLPVINGDHDPQGNGYNVGTATRLFSQSDGAGTERIDNQTVYTELVLPDNRSLRFRYNEYGEVAEVELPTGGKVQYDYAYDGQLPSGNSLSIETRTTFRILSDVSDIDRAVVARRTYTNGTTLDASWSYDYRPQTAPNSVSYACTEVKATSAAGTLLLSQRHFFMAAQRYINTTSGDGTGYALWSTGVEWRTESRDAANAVMSASEQDWSQRAAVSWSTYTQEQPANDNRVNESRSILDDGQVARVTTTYEPGVSYNNPIEVKEYDYGNTLKRSTTTSYLTTNTTGGVTYNYRTDDAIHLLSLPSQQSIIEGSVERARTVYAYDNYTPDTNNAALLDYGAMNYDANGNLINDTYSGFGSRTYDAENRMVTAADNGGGQSQYTYDADGHRVRRQTGAQQIWQVYGIEGEMVAEYAAGDAATAPQKEYGYRNGELLITAEAPSSTGINVAQNRTATQSSNLVGGVAGRAVDGNTNGDWNYSSVTHTDYNNQGWWEVDLGSVQSLSNVKVWNRTDCCGSRLSNFYIFVSDVPFTSHDLTLTMGQSGVASYYTAGAAGTSVTQAVNRTGRYVRVQLAGADYLSLSEVQVFSANAATGIEWLVTDQLGTPRMVADKSGTLSGIRRHDYLPFGEELFTGTGGRTTAQGYVTDGVRQKFTQKERDVETGLDYFLARYHSSTQGRFTSPDEFTGGPDELYDFVDDAADNPTFYADLANPQSLNKYQYGYNNPLRYNDPDGHCPDCAAQVIKWVVPLIPAIPLAPPIAVVGAIAIIAASIPGDNTQGDGSCPSCEVYIRNSQRRLEQQEANRLNLRNQNNSGDQSKEKDFKPVEGRDTINKTPRQANREAKRKSGVPTSQTHDTHREERDKTNPGKTVVEHDYTVRGKGGRREVKTIPNHRNGHPQKGKVPRHFNDTNGGHHIY